MKRYLITCEEICPQCKGEKTTSFVPYQIGGCEREYELDGPCCPSCKGIGVIRKEVDLAEAMNHHQVQSSVGPLEFKVRRNGK